jgi:hypothetical protein
MAYEVLQAFGNSEQFKSRILLRQFRGPFVDHWHTKKGNKSRQLAVARKANFPL